MVEELGSVTIDFAVQLSERTSSCMSYRSFNTRIPLSLSDPIESYNHGQQYHDRGKEWTQNHVCRLDNLT
jgi:hypothetical protein